MDSYRVTALDPTDELALLRAQHASDLATLDLAADIIACQDTVIARLQRDQSALILESRRAERRAY